VLLNWRFKTAYNRGCGVVGQAESLLLRGDLISTDAALKIGLVDQASAPAREYTLISKCK
jgi:enoyl-CoA hydratase/carnithine racemase